MNININKNGEVKTKKGKLDIGDNVLGAIAIIAGCLLLAFICYMGITTDAQQSVKTVAQTEAKIASLRNYQGSVIIDKKINNNDKPTNIPRDYYVTIYWKPYSTRNGITKTIHVSEYEYNLFNTGATVKF